MKDTRGEGREGRRGVVGPPSSSDDVADNTHRSTLRAVARSDGRGCCVIRIVASPPSCICGEGGGGSSFVVVCRLVRFRLSSCDDVAVNTRRSTLRAVARSGGRGCYAVGVVVCRRRPLRLAFVAREVGVGCCCRRSSLTSPPPRICGEGGF